MKRALLHLMAGCVSACANDPLSPPAATTGQVALVLPALKVMAHAAASGGSGHSLFDNHVPCVRRGVLTYSDQGNDRLVTWHGCYLGPGLSATGSGRLSPQGAGAWRWNGRLHVTLHDTAIVAIDSFTVSGVDSSLSAQLRDTGGLSLETIPNPGGSLDALTAADLERIANHPLMVLGSFLLNETMETGRGDHIHDFPFGTTAVTVVNHLPRLENAWSVANLGGVIVDGDFDMFWGIFDTVGNSLNAIRLDMQGSFRLGGGLPRVVLTQLTWQVEGTGGGFPTTAQITLELRGPSGGRTYRTSVRVDD